MTISQAVAAASARRLTLIQGPPGTGKTRCSIAILAKWVEQMSKRCKPNEKVLATSGSNIAVDNLVEGLAAAGVHVLRLGRPESIRPELTRHCLDFIVAGGDGMGGGDGRERQDAHRRKMRALNEAQVICATCIGAGAGILDRYRFPCVALFFFLPSFLSPRSALTLRSSLSSLLPTSQVCPHR